MISSLTQTRLQDPDLAGTTALVVPDVPAPLVAAYAQVGTDIEDVTPVTITWWPGRSLTMRFQVEGQGGSLAGNSQAVAVVGSLPTGALEVSDGESRVGVWTIPNDPALPGLPSALDLETVNELLSGLGANERANSTRLRAYRPARRAVVEVTAGTSSIFLKVVPPDEVDSLHQRHRHLASVLPVPDSLGVSRDLGVIAMRALPGRDLRDVMRQGGLTPPPEEVAALLPKLAEPLVDDRVASPFRSLPRISDRRCCRSRCQWVRHRQHQSPREPSTHRVGRSAQPRRGGDHGDHEARLRGRAGTGFHDRYRRVTRFSSGEW